MYFIRTKRMLEVRYNKRKDKWLREYTAYGAQKR